MDHTWSGVGMNLGSLKKIAILPSLWQVGDEVSLTFPGNGILKRGKVIKVAFTAHTEPLYDVEVPYQYFAGSSRLANGV